MLVGMAFGSEVLAVVLNVISALPRDQPTIRHLLQGGPSTNSALRTEMRIASLLG
jgi:hypothetical protein